ncbi:MAG: preprotein translocase subunit SecE [Firmicutes bacterium]|nr:preprotein translocase subunit SecE [Bacillota bacterium]
MAKNANKPSGAETGGKEKKAKAKTTAVTMAEKRAQQRKKQQTKQKREKGRMKEYFKGVRLEMKKVVWPTRKELGSFTAVVLATCAAFALLFWGVDSGVLAAIKAICF